LSRENKFEFKHLNAYPNEMLAIAPFLGIVFYTFVSYAKLHDLPVVVTRIFAPVIGESGVHTDGRGMDVSHNGWTKFHISRVTKKINEMYPHWGTSSTGLNTRVLVYHKVDGGTYHFHLQVRRGLKFME